MFIEEGGELVNNAMFNTIFLYLKYERPNDIQLMAILEMDKAIMMWHVSHH